MYWKRSQNSLKAFTLLEVLLAMSILVGLTAISIPVLQSTQFNTEYTIARNSTIHALRRAQTLSQAAKNDSQWGVKLNSGLITIFEGGDYLNRNIGYDEVIDITHRINFTGIDEIVFTKSDGMPTNFGTIDLAVANLSGSITVTPEGVIDY